MPLQGQKTNFSEYQASVFGARDHGALETALRRSAKHGAIVLASNSMAADSLYYRWERSEMVTRRSIAASGGGRSMMTELLFHGLKR
jgi:site-specific DNA-adenine methylase